jgi:cytochrome c oxidase cbb3-type subunit 3
MARAVRTSLPIGFLLLALTAMGGPAGARMLSARGAAATVPAREPAGTTPASVHRRQSARNPFEGSATAVAEGAKLFVAYNCADCHGAEGSGAMGPSLQDNRWRFGGSASEVYRSIADGRPEGMPTWGPLIPVDQIWKLVTYVHSLGAGKDVSTENFTGETVERTGH